jgi:transmembrane sensor
MQGRGCAVPDIILFPKAKGESLRSIRAEAARWFVRLEAGQLSRTEHISLQVWLNKDPRHAQAFYEAAKLTDDLAVLGVLAPLFPLQGIRPSLAKRALERVSGLWSESRAKIAMGCAAAVVASLLVLPFVDVADQVKPSESIVLSSLTTEMGESRDFHLEDGSVVKLNSRSRVDLRYSDDSRALILQYGEAQFDVAPDASRPFLVRAREHVLRAIGTAFNVRLNDESVELTVTHGIVGVDKVADTTSSVESSDQWIVAASGDSKASGNRVSAGEQAELGLQDVPSIAPVLPDQMAAKLAWQQGEIVFQGESLQEAIAEVNRYSAQQLVIVDDRIKTIPIGGRFKTGELANLLDILEHGFGIAATSVTPGKIELAAKDAEQ